MIRSFMLALLFALSAPTLAAPTADAARPVINVEQHENIRVAYDVKDDVWDAGIGKALYYVRGLLEAYKDQGVAPPESAHQRGAARAGGLLGAQ